MEQFQPQLWDRMKEGDASNYRQACPYAEGNCIVFMIINWKKKLREVRNLMPE